MIFSGMHLGCLFSHYQMMNPATRDNSLAASHWQILESCIKSGAMRSATTSSGMEAQPRHPSVARAQAEDAGSAGSRGSSGFGGPEFWAALRQVAGLEIEARALLADARAVLRRRSVLPLMVSEGIGTPPLFAWLLCPQVFTRAEQCLLCGRLSRTLHGRAS